MINNNPPPSKNVTIFEGNNNEGKRPDNNIITLKDPESTGEANITMI